jgi:hypothetical protein
VAHYFAHDIAAHPQDRHMLPPLGLDDLGIDDLGCEVLSFEDHPVTPRRDRD